MKTMRKILLVDDEPIFRMGLRTIVPWEELGCQIIGEAKNGVEALVQIEEKQPDIVFLDIKMPKMDGIQVLEKRKNCKGNPKFVVLSCFNEYEYVREAMKLGACDYLFKPLMEGKDIVAVIREIQNRDDHVEEDDKNSYNRICNCLLSVVNGEEEKEKLIDLDQNFFQNSYFFLAVELQVKDYTHQKAEALLMLAREVLMRCFDDRRVPYFFEKNQVLYGMFFIGEGDEYFRESKRQNLWKEIKDYVEIPIWIGCSGTLKGSDNLEEAFRRVQKALDAHFFSCYQRDNVEYLEYSDGLENTYNFELIYKNELDQISEAFGEADPQKIKDILNGICESILREKRWNEKDFLHFLANIIIGNMRRYRQQNLMEQLIMEEYNVISNIYHQNNMKQSCEYLSQLLEKIFEKIYENSAQDSNYREIQKTVEYMKVHYPEKISLQEMADRTHLSTKYFCKLFKIVTGDTFVNRLTAIRIEAACELLKNSDLKTYEVAEKTGFGNYHHFSKTFRKVTGKTPSEIRKL